MIFKIGFTAEHLAEQQQEPACAAHTAPRKSVVQVSFPGRGMALTYYNDRFDLNCGDMVYVDGKLEGQLGRITEINYNFKIKVSDYKRVIAVIDTNVHGQFHMAGSYFLTFDRETLPLEKVTPWFKAPVGEDNTFISGNDDSFFLLDDLAGMKVSAAVAERGHSYYLENRVRYISVDGTKGYAIVVGNEAYEVEFEYHNGQIRHLICSCFCSYNCKHEVAAMLQLRETLELIGKYHEAAFARSGYFAAICKRTLFAFAIDDADTGCLTL